MLWQRNMKGATLPSWCLRLRFDTSRTSPSSPGTSSSFLRAAAVSPRTPAPEAAAAATRVAARSRQAARRTPAQVGATPVALLSGAAVGPAPGPVAPQLREVQAT